MVEARSEEEYAAMCQGKAEEEEAAQAACDEAEALAEALLALTGQIETVRYARSAKAATGKLVEEKRLAFMEDNKALLTVNEAACKEVMEAEARLRELTLAAYTLDPTCKKPAPGVGIREIKHVNYDPLEARRWAFEHKICLELDKKAFEVLAKSTDAQDMPATITLIAQATISEKLGGDT